MRVVKKRRIFVILLVILVILASSVFIWIYINNNKNSKNLVYDNFEPIITKIDDNVYYMIGVNSNISFEINKDKDFSLEVVDSDNKEIDVNIIENDGVINVMPPNELYKEGSSYKIKITNGTFKDEMLKDAKEIIFSIKRPASQSYKFKDNIKMVSKNEISIDNNIISLRDKYKENDVIVVFDNDKIKEGYIIKKINDNGSYEVDIPDMNDIFLEYDYYGMEKVNLANYKTTDDIKNYLMTVIKKQLVNTVYADKKINIEGPTWNKKQNRLSYKVIIYLNEGDKLFDKDFLKYHKSQIEFDVSIEALLYRNISLDYFDYAMIVNIDINSLINLKNNNKIFNELNDAIDSKNKLYDCEWVIDEYDKLNKEEVNIEETIGDILLDTNVPGMYINLKTGMVINIQGFSNLESMVSDSIRLVGGVNKDIGIYGEYSHNSDGNITSFGSVNTTVGNPINMEIQFMNINKLLLSINSGLDISGNLNKDKEDDKIVKIDNKASLALNSHYNVISNDNGEDKKKTIFSKKEDIHKYESNGEFDVKKKEEENVNIKQYTANEIRKMLKNGYDLLAKENKWRNVGNSNTTNYVMTKEIDVDKNVLTGTWNYDNDQAIYTCSYNYLDDKMNCSNFEETQNYVKNICDNIYNQYLIFEETGECDNEIAEEWDFMFDSLDDCYYENMSRNEPDSFKDDIDKILEAAMLTYDDLNLLK